jgi:hypothetical protein
MHWLFPEFVELFEAVLRRLVTYGRQAQMALRSQSDRSPAYYNFVWRTRHTDQSGKRGKLRPTAAMMAKVTRFDAINRCFQ